MDIKVILIDDVKEKSLYTEKILRKLPQWFGNEKALMEYVEGVKDLPFFGAMNQDGDCIGFVSIKLHYEQTGDIYVCGVLPDYHNKGIGKKLFASVEKHLLQNGCKYIIVKTLSEIANYEPYERTRLFYKSVGFDQLITLKEMWDKQNPCLIMIKVL